MGRNPLSTVICGLRSLHDQLTHHQLSKNALGHAVGSTVSHNSQVASVYPK